MAGEGKGETSPSGQRPDEAGQGHRLFLIDGSGLLFRAYFALLRQPLTTSQGQDVGAVFGFLNTLLALIREERASHLAVAFDAKGPTFRHERYPHYKANRPAIPPELAAQIPLIHRLVAAMGLPALMQEGVEADDLIGSAAKAAAARDWNVVIVSSDKDFSQLIGPRILQYIPSRRGEPPERLGPEEIEAKWGIRPEQFIDFLALTGDASDNIPGVRGVGPKTAAALLQQHGSLTQLYADLESVKPRSVREKLAAGREKAWLSRELVGLRTDLRQPDPETLRVPDPGQRGELRTFLEEMEFHRVKEKLFPAEGQGGDPVGGSAGEGSGGEAQLSLDVSVDDREGSHDASVPVVGDDWGHKYQLISNRSTLEGAVRAFSRRSKMSPVLALDTETSGLDPRRADLVGLSFGWQPGKAWYIPLGHRDGPNLALESVREGLGPLLADPQLTKAGQNLKFDLHVLGRYGLDSRGPLIDTMVASYVRDPGAHHGLDALAQEFLQHRMVPIEALIGHGRDQVSMAEVPVSKAVPYACEDADAVTRLLPHLQKRLEEMGAWNLFCSVEMPLVPILLGMERAGVTLDSSMLQVMGRSLAGDIQRQEAQVHRLAGEAFNINSPKQLQRILFVVLRLKPRRRTKTGFSTGQEVLEELAAEHPIAARILEYRQLNKLRSTYLETLPRLVDPRTGRIHATFHQTVTATGRLSSSNPNLQNIPIRSQLGREIRRAFVARPGHRLFSADYSQIELRILAHLSEDPYLVRAFQEGADIHRATAARVFGVSEDAVQPAMRSRAKVVNFGVLYGMGARRLAREQGIPVKEATQFIAEYFQKLPGVKSYIDRCVSEAHSRGYAETLLGRRRYLPEIQSTRQQARAAAERMAVNTPVQGSAADLIKLAMVRLQRRLDQDHPQVQLLIQVHDELVFEVPEGEVEALQELVTQEMAQVMHLRIPLRVETGTGRDWFEAHA